MQLSLSVVLLSFAACLTTATRAFPFCAEASRFGDIRPQPFDVKPGESFTMHTDFRCALQFGVTPKYLDYHIEVNNEDDPTGLHIPISIGRRTFQNKPQDQFSVKLPKADWIPKARYSVALQTTYPVNGTDYFEIGTIETYINIVGI